MSELVDFLLARIAEEYVRKVVDGAPPLTQEQHDRLRALLAPTKRPAPRRFEVSQPLDVRIEP